MIRRPASSVKNKLLGYRATAAEISAVERAAKKAGKTSISEWLREIVKKEIERACV